ncbi:hypothetical protein BGZ99_008125 [Dissophora globulifera]|uniref:Uncharacterized protein n=1 Tax=Dissophora globulifera TaxID=979702 RepID=A0A9P6RCK6_9FUNG|nr:hypothetical protein BGZ99_008125 [Dissophora globulifera]
MDEDSFSDSGCSFDMSDGNLSLSIGNLNIDDDSNSNGDRSGYNSNNGRILDHNDQASAAGISRPIVTNEDLESIARNWNKKLIEPDKEVDALCVTVLESILLNWNELFEPDEEVDMLREIYDVLFSSDITNIAYVRRRIATIMSFRQDAIFLSLSQRPGLHYFDEIASIGLIADALFAPDVAFILDVVIKILPLIIARIDSIRLKLIPLVPIRFWLYANHCAYV